MYLYNDASLASSSLSPSKAASFCSSAVVFPSNRAAFVGVFTAMGTSCSTTGTAKIAANPSSKDKSHAFRSALTISFVNFARLAVTVTYRSNLDAGLNNLYHARGVTIHISGSSSPYLKHQSHTSTSFNACGGLSSGTKGSASTSLGAPRSPPSNFLAFPSTTTPRGFTACTCVALPSSNLSLNSYSSSTRIGSVAPGVSRGASYAPESSRAVASLPPRLAASPSSNAFVSPRTSTSIVSASSAAADIARRPPRRAPRASANAASRRST